jgi:Cu(I)/Ag(I) efflux system membrane fusion protein
MGSAMLTCFDEREALPVTPVGEIGAENAMTQPSVQTGLIEVTAAEQRQIDALAKAYLTLQQMLYQGRHEEAPEVVAAVAEAATALAQTDDPRQRTLAEAVIRETADAKPADLPSLRAAFKSLSTAVTDLLEVAPPSPGIGTLYAAYCPMAKGSWLQVGQQIKNPYYGEDHAMADCGDIEQTIAPRARP